MFKVKLTITVIALGLIVGETGVLYLNQLETKHTNQQKAALVHAEKAIDMVLSQKRLVRGFLARSIQDGTIPAYLSTVEAFRQEMKEMETNEWKAYPDRDEASSKAREKMVADSELPDKFIATLQKKLTDRFGENWLEMKNKEKFLNEEKQRFIKCASIGLDQCVWDYTYNNYQILAAELLDKYNFKTSSRVIIMDAHGYGVADSQDPKWSHKKGYVDAHKVAKKAVQKNGFTEGMDLIREEYYMTVAMPLNYKGKLVGVVEVGDSIDEALLNKWYDIAGVKSIAVVKGKVASSTVDDSHLTDTLAKQSKDEFEGNVVTRNAFYKIGGENNDTIKLVLVKDLSAMIDGFSSARLYLVIITLLLILIALGLIASFYKTFITPFEVMDQGLHEIVNGNKDYQFPYDFKEKIARTLSNSLNLTVLVLQGKPIPDEEVSQSGWSEEMASTSDMDVDLSTEEKAALIREPRDKYFERLYKEFVEARKQAGHLEGHDFNKFIQKVIRSENAFKSRLKAKEVRMVVVIKGDDVGLYPIPYTEEEMDKFTKGLW